MNGEYSVLWILSVSFSFFRCFSLRFYIVLHCPTSVQGSAAVLRAALILAVHPGKWKSLPSALPPQVVTCSKHSLSQ